MTNVNEPVRCDGIRKIECWHKDAAQALHSAEHAPRARGSQVLTVSLLLRPTVPVAIGRRGTSTCTWGVGWGRRKSDAIRRTTARATDARFSAEIETLWDTAARVPRGVVIAQRGVPVGRPPAGPRAPPPAPPSLRPLATCNTDANARTRQPKNMVATPRRMSTTTGTSR